VIYFTCTQNLATDFSRSRDRIVGIEIENGLCDLDHTPSRGWLVIQKLGFCTVYLCAKFDNSSFSRSRDITGGSKI